MYMLVHVYAVEGREDLILRYILHVLFQAAISPHPCNVGRIAHQLSPVDEKG
jgi:hypothetical protein